MNILCCDGKFMVVFKKYFTQVCEKYPISRSDSCGSGGKFDFIPIMYQHEKEIKTPAIKIVFLHVMRTH